MRIVVATDSFKGSLDAQTSSRIIADAVRSARPGVETIVKPMADGGEGTAAAMMSALGGEWIPARVMGPLPEMQVEAGFAWFPATRMALVEMAAASGLTLLRRDQLNPLLATTYGTGQLMDAAFRRGARRLLLAVGGSATVDGGAGAASALGWRFVDAGGRDVPLGGGHLLEIERITPPEGGTFPPVEVLCDVKNPLCGDNGAARVFGPQKGATPQMVERLDAGLTHLASLVRATLGKEIGDVPAGGAAGGLAAGAMAFVNAALESGIERIIEVSGLARDLRNAGWVVTGEGSFDGQSLQGKVVSGVIDAARRERVRVVVIAGLVQLAEGDWRAAGVEWAVPLARPGMSLEYSMEHVRDLLDKRAREWAEKML